MMALGRVTDGDGRMLGDFVQGEGEDLKGFRRISGQVRSKPEKPGTPFNHPSSFI